MKDLRTLTQEEHIRDLRKELERERFWRMAVPRTRTETIVYSLLLSLVIVACRILLQCHDLLKNRLS
jgi:hypothetical protein